MSVSRPVMLGNAVLGDIRPERRKRRGGQTTPDFLVLRIANIDTIIRRRFGRFLANDATGRRFAFAVANHLADNSKAEGAAVARFGGWARRWCPWMQTAEGEAMARKAFADPRRWTADGLAWSLGVTMAERTACEAWTIGAIDVSRAQREAARRARKRCAGKARRQAGGATPRADYEAASASRRKPWDYFKKSRSWWYANGRPDPVGQVRGQYQETSPLEAGHLSDRPSKLTGRGAPEARPAAAAEEPSERSTQMNEIKTINPRAPTTAEAGSGSGGPARPPSRGTIPHSPAALGIEPIAIVARRRIAWARQNERHEGSGVISAALVRFNLERPVAEYGRAVEFVRGAPPRPVIVAQMKAMKDATRAGGPPGFSEAAEITRMLLAALDDATMIIRWMEMPPA